MCRLVGHDKELGFDSSCKKKPVEGLEHRCERALAGHFRKVTLAAVQSMHCVGARLETQAHRAVRKLL